MNTPQVYIVYTLPVLFYMNVLLICFPHDTFIQIKNSFTNGTHKMSTSIFT